jgi:hypothetical protein
MVSRTRQQIRLLSLLVDVDAAAETKIQMLKSLNSLLVKAWVFGTFTIWSKQRQQVHLQLESQLQRAKMRQTHHSLDKGLCLQAQIQLAKTVDPMRDLKRPVPNVVQTFALTNKNC